MNAATLKRHELIDTLRTSRSARVLDDLARTGLDEGMALALVHNPHTPVRTLELIADTFLGAPRGSSVLGPLVRSAHTPAPLVDRIVHLSTDRNVIYQAASSPTATIETIMFVKSHPAAPATTVERIEDNLAARCTPAH